jgi:K+-sensing histidine kinase KdpD
LTKRNAELARVDAEKNQFLGMVAHDLRNPLTVIQAYSEFLSELQGRVIGTRELKFINSIGRSSELILGLVDDLLDTSKIAAGHLVLNKRPTDLNALIEHNLSLNRVLAERRQVRLDYKSTAEFSNVLLDVRKIDQVLNNLVDNAIKVSPPQGTVAVRLSREGDSALLGVTDQGPGIPAEELEVIFPTLSAGAPRNGQGRQERRIGPCYCEQHRARPRGTPMGRKHATKRGILLCPSPCFWNIDINGQDRLSSSSVARVALSGRAALLARGLGRSRATAAFGVI